MARKNCSDIGGQAVLEGVMMRGTGAEAVAVRDPRGVIQLESRRLESKKPLVKRIPVVRGVAAFVQSFVDGTKILIRSGEVYGEDPEAEASAFEKKLEEKLKISPVKLAAFVGALLGIILAVVAFVVVPTYVTRGIYTLVKLDSLNSYLRILIENLTIGVLKLAVFLIYLAAVGRMKEIKRLFAYHGAEHKTIACYEAGEELTPSNVMKHTRFHDRCGTNFIFIVMTVSIFFNALFFALIGWDPQITVLEVLVRIALIPVIAGLSYEVLKAAAKYDNIFVRVLKAPGLALQRLTTREPDEKMTEVAIAAFNEVMKLQSDATEPVKRFMTFSGREAVEKALKKTLEPVGASDNEVGLIMMYVTGTETFGALKSIRYISKDDETRMKELAAKRAEGRPLQHVLGEAYFYGRTFRSDARALIPRQDTEILAETAVNAVREAARDDKAVRVLELCTGSGAVAVTVNLETGAKVTASDVSDEALSLAYENASALNAEVEFVKSDMFENIAGRFDLIIANPPYIPTADLNALEPVVKDFEPRLALDGGSDGLDFYVKIAAKYQKFLNDGGELILEVGKGQADAVEKIFGLKAKRVCDYNVPPVDRVLVFEPGSADPDAQKDAQKGEIE